MPLCERHQMLTFYSSACAAPVELPVDVSECEMCIELQARREQQAEFNQQQLTLFIQNLRSIPRPEGWKNAILNRILPKN